MTSGPTAPIEVLEWDSRHFGVKIARLPEPGDADQIERGIAAAEQAGVRCLTTLIELNRPAVIAAAEMAGFRSYDVRLELDRTLGETVPGEPVVATDADLPRFEAIARASFFDSRFYADPNFANERAAEMYALWVRRGLGDDQRVLLTTEEDGGFIVCHFDAAEQIGTIDLIAVDGEARGRGIGSRLVEGAEIAFNRAGMTRARVVTQARNVPAQRLYQGRGYRTAGAAVWLHRWADQRQTHPLR
jgi:dTDP-4-amino-4,6-dideoxy-D-galactose acyltransferase